jgi:hypothetical protein
MAPASFPSSFALASFYPDLILSDSFCKRRRHSLYYYLDEKGLHNTMAADYSTDLVNHWLNLNKESFVIQPKNIVDDNALEANTNKKHSIQKLNMKSKDFKVARTWIRMKLNKMVSLLLL